MQKAIEKARVLIEALPYIQKFRDSIIVVKFGGSAMEDVSCKESILTDIALMECVGMLPVVVHGGGKAISRGLAEAGIESKFVRGLRVTCEKSIRVVEKVMKEQVNPDIVNTLKARGAEAETLDGEDIFRVSRKKDIDAETGAILDWGFVGEPGEVDDKPVHAVLKKRRIPVITPLGRGPDGKLHNINADEAAAAAARALKARKLVFLSDVPGLLREKDDPESVITTLDMSEVETLTEKGIIAGGMLPKVLSGVDAITAGVGKVHLVDGRMPHSLLLEIYTDKGVGTEIVERQS